MEPQVGQRAWYRYHGCRPVPCEVIKVTKTTFTVEQLLGPNMTASRKTGEVRGMSWRHTLSLDEKTCLEEIAAFDAKQARDRRITSLKLLNWENYSNGAMDKVIAIINDTKSLLRGGE